MWAGIAGLILVVLFMWAYYRLPGFLASLALFIYALYVFAIFKMIPVTLTLPGIAGFILSVGMAVDANILIFERMKEELRDGRTLRAAIDAGFSRALTAIVDSNACTLIACAVLGFYGTGPVKGFAVTLAIGVVVSLFTAITVTRTLLHLLDNAPQFQKSEYFGTSVQWMGKWAQGRDIIGRRRLYYTISLGVILPGLLFLLGGQLRRGVDFTGGNEWIVQAHRLRDSQVTTALRDAGLARDQFTMQTGTSLDTGDRLATIHTKPGVMTPAIQAKTLDTLQRQEGVRDAATASNEHIDPIIGKELEWNALSAVFIASCLIVFYLTVRFMHDGFKNGIKYGVCAIAAMLHDVLVVLGLFAIFGFILQVEIDMNFVTAILTIIGFSVHDTIVIFDRVRENLQKRRKGESFEEIYNRSIVQTAARSINTSFTVILVLAALVLFGDPVIRWFNVALLVGIISGTYSSIFNASPLVVDWQLIKRRREERASGAASAQRAAPASGPAAQTLRQPARQPAFAGANGGSPLRPTANGNGRPAGSTLRTSNPDVSDAGDSSGTAAAGSADAGSATSGSAAAGSAAAGNSPLGEDQEFTSDDAGSAPGADPGMSRGPGAAGPGRTRMTTVRPVRPAAGKVLPKRKQRH
ncbi:MAG: protein translocase subunit SecF [Chloroflexi bacterium]|nr:protein translocase subunit SecF [Chloroflexota bacterium]